MIRINHEYNRHGPGPGTSTTLSQNQHINTKKGESIQSGTTTYLGYPSYPTTGHVHVFVATVSVNCNTNSDLDLGHLDLDLAFLNTNTFQPRCIRVIRRDTCLSNSRLAQGVQGL